MVLRSIRWKIQLWHGCLLAGIVFILIVGYYNLERRARIREIDLRLRTILTPLLPAVTSGRPPPPPPGGEPFRRREPPPGEGRPPPPEEFAPPEGGAFRPPGPRSEGRRRVLSELETMGA